MKLAIEVSRARKTRASRLDQELRGLVIDGAINVMGQGRLLGQIKEEKLWKELGHASFKLYAETVTGRSYRVLSQSIRVAKHFEGRESMIRGLPIVALSEMTRAGLDALQERRYCKLLSNQKMTVTQLIEELQPKKQRHYEERRARGEKIRGSRPVEVRRSHTVCLSFTKDEFEIYRAEIEKSREKYGNLNDGSLIVAALIGKVLS